MNFLVETSDIAQAEIEAIYFRLLAYDTEFAARWLEGLNRALVLLETFPRRNERVSQEGAPGRETRRLLYKNGRAVYRIIYLLVDNDGDGEEETVRVLQVRQGA